MTYYDTLQVLPSAEDAVIRSAYRSLMRLYHPDTNNGPEADRRVREITAAFAVLGDPQSRAAYDAQRVLHDSGVNLWPVSDQGSRPPLRNLGIGAIALALTVSLATPLWLKANQPQHSNGTSSASSDATQTTAAAELLGRLRDRDLPHLNNASRSREPTATLSVARSASIQSRSSFQANDRSFKHWRDMGRAVVALRSKSMAMPLAASALASQHKSPASIQTAAEGATVARAQFPTSPTCSASSNITGQACTVDRRAEIQRLASLFLTQSIAHADWQKQQLLLSARNRAAFSRALCHSDPCVIGTYMREMRETTEIMQGRIPQP